jgi:FKBP-type peptidyl-prolyl cis-trans isomerase FkpA
MKFISILFSLSLTSLLLFDSCSKTQDIQDFSTIDKNIIKEYINTHNLTADSTSSGLYYVIQKPGTGQTPSLYSDIKIRYKGMLTSGEVFDEATSAIQLNLSRVIAGWQQGIPKFKEGGEGILLIPSSLGYGSQSTGSIPANSVLIFEIKLDEVL